MGICLSVLTNKHIFNCISEDGVSHNDLKIDVINELWLLITEGEKAVGICQFKSLSINMIEGHIHILPEMRKYSIDAGHSIMTYLGENMEGILSTVNFPFLYPNVKDFVVKFDFKLVGILQDAWTKDNKTHDMWNYSKKVKKWVYQQD